MCKRDFELRFESNGTRYSISADTQQKYIERLKECFDNKDFAQASDVISEELARYGGWE